MIKPTKTNRVVDTVQTRLQELIESLKTLYEMIDKELTELSQYRCLEEVNTILIEGFRNVLDGRPPIDPVSDAPSTDDEVNDDSDLSTEQTSEGDGQENELEKAQAAEEQKKQQVENLIKMMQSW